VTLKFLAEYLHLSPATVFAGDQPIPAAKSIPERTRRKFCGLQEIRLPPEFLRAPLEQEADFHVGVVVPEISEGYAALVLSGVEDRLLQEAIFILSSAIVDGRI